MAKDSDDLIEEAGKGHNSFSKETLRQLIQQIESLNEEKKNLQEDIKAVYEAAKQKGFDKTAIKEAIKLRAIDAEKRREREETRDLYLAALDLI